MIAADIFVDGFFAAVAAIGFGAISDPPLRAFPSIALLAAAGHALRFGLMTCAGLDITTATLCAFYWLYRVGRVCRVFSVWSV